MTPPADAGAPIGEHGDGVVISGEALALMYRACLALVARRHRDGLAAEPLLSEARKVLYRACAEMSSRRQGFAGTAPAGACCNGHDDELLDSATAAARLGVSVRTVQRLAATGQLLATRVGSTWCFRESDVMALAAQRRKARR